MGFEEYFLNLTVENNQRNPWFVGKRLSTLNLIEIKKTPNKRYNWLKSLFKTIYKRVETRPRINKALYNNYSNYFKTGMMLIIK